VAAIPYIKAAVVWNMSLSYLADMFCPADGGSRILLNARTYEHTQRIPEDVFAITI
jgi:hypothetical protein